MENNREEFLKEMTNKYSYKVEDIEVALDRLKAISQTLNIAPEEVIEDVFRIATIARESGEVAGNALRSIYSKLTEQYLVEIGIDTTQNASSVLEQLSKHYKGLESGYEQREFLSNIGGRYNLARTGALLENR